MLDKEEFSELISRIRTRYYEFYTYGFDGVADRLRSQPSRIEVENLIDIIAYNLAIVLLAGLAAGVEDAPYVRLGVFQRFTIDTIELMETKYVPEDGLVDQLRELPERISIEHIKARMHHTCKLTLLLFSIA